MFAKGCILKKAKKQFVILSSIADAGSGGSKFKSCEKYALANCIEGYLFLFGSNVHIRVMDFKLNVNKCF